MKKLKLFLILCLLSSLSYGEGPLFSHKDPIVQQEFENIYQNLRSVLTLNSSSKCIDDPTFCVDVVGDDVSLADGTLVAHSDGWVLQATQPSFLVYPLAHSFNVTGDATVFTAVFDSEIIDVGSNFNTGTYTFTAPVSGKYLLYTTIQMDGLSDANHTIITMQMVTSNRIYENQIRSILTSMTRYTMDISVLADMDANDTTYLTLKVDGTSKSVDYYGITTAQYSRFSGSLIN